MTLPPQPDGNPDPKSDGGKGVWFEYSTSAGRFTAIPVSAMGWLVLMAVILAPMAIIGLLAPFFARLPFIIQLPLLFGLIVAAVLGAMKIAISKGRRRR